jgi:hypothetical protein
MFSWQQENTAIMEETFSALSVQDLVAIWRLYIEMIEAKVFRTFI